MRNGDPRTAALMLLGPLLLAVLHQDALGGAATHQLDIDRLVMAIGAAFVRAHATD